MTAFVLGLPETKVRVIAPDVGGGFGSKIYLYAEETALVWASKKVNRPIKWAADRSEAFLTDAHGRDHVTHAELALDKDGKFLAMRVQTTANMGAYLSTFASCIPTILYATLLAGQYTTPAIFCEVTASFTNTAPVDAYRGAGRPEATFVVERIVHQAAVDTGHRAGRDSPAQFHPQVSVCDAGGADLRHRQLRRDARRGDEGRRRRRVSRRARPKPPSAASCAGWAMRRISRRAGSRRRTSRARSARARGLFEAGQVRVNPTGSVTVFTGSHSHGQGHETTFAQIVAATARHRHRQCRSRARRHRPHPVRHGHLWFALAVRGRHRDRQGAGQGDRQGQEDRGAPARGGGGRHRVQGRQVHRRRHRPQQGVRGSVAGRVRAAQLSAGQAGARPRRNRVLRSDQFHVSGRARTSAKSRSIRKPAW